MQTPTITRLTAAVLFAAFAAQAFELESWRTPYIDILQHYGVVRSSPSGLFWDDLKADSMATELWPDPALERADHWKLAPSVTASASNAAYGDGRRAFGLGRATSDFRYGHLLARNVLTVDTRYSADPLRFKTDRGLAGRLEEAYVQIDGGLGFLRLGRTARNWGPFADRSLILSNAALTYDALEWQIAGPFFEYRHLFTMFPPQRSELDTYGGRTNRYLTAHSLTFMFGRWASLGVSETVLFSNDGGLPDLQYVNPVAVYFVTNTNQESDGNLMISVQAAAHPFTESLTLKAQAIIDDIQVDNNGQADQEPNHWGCDAGIYWSPPLRLPSRLSLEYRYLSRWLYLVSNGNTLAGQRYTYLRDGLGFQDTDRDRWQLGFSLIGPRWWMASASAAYQRAGGNTLQSPWNTDRGDNGYRTETSLRSDSTEHTVELSVQGLAYLATWAGLSLRFDNRWVRNQGAVRSSGFVYDPRVSLSVDVHYDGFYWLFDGGPRFLR